jgi:hypothetical protein
MSLIIDVDLVASCRKLTFWVSAIELEAIGT